VFDRLKRALRDESGRLQTPIYPGSPLLIAKALRRGDRLVACELRPDDHAALDQRLRRLGARAEAVRGDGYAEAVQRLGALAAPARWS
jgi:23S rRNA (adenine2030-N6)-methyltransferase